MAASRHDRQAVHQGDTVILRVDGRGVVADADERLHFVATTVAALPVVDTLIRAQ